MKHTNILLALIVAYLSMIHCHLYKLPYKLQETQDPAFLGHVYSVGIAVLAVVIYFVTWSMSEKPKEKKKDE